MRKNFFLAGLILLNFVKISAKEATLCISKGEGSGIGIWLNVTPQRTIQIVDKSNASTLWEMEIKTVQPPMPTAPKGKMIAQVMPSPITVTAFKSVNPAGYLACTSTGKIYLSETKNEETGWRTRFYETFKGGHTSYISEKYGFSLYDLLDKMKAAGGISIEGSGRADVESREVLENRRMELQRKQEELKFKMSELQMEQEAVMQELNSINKKLGKTSPVKGGISYPGGSRKFIE